MIVQVVVAGTGRYLFLGTHLSAESEPINIIARILHGENFSSLFAIIYVLIIISIVVITAGSSSSK